MGSTRKQTAWEPLQTDYFDNEMIPAVTLKVKA